MRKEYPNGCSFFDTTGVFQRRLLQVLKETNYEKVQFIKNDYDGYACGDWCSYFTTS